MNGFKLINYNYTFTENKWFNNLSNEDICNIIHEYYIKNNDKLNNADKKNKGESFIEELLIQLKVPYIRSSSKNHSGDFICYDKILIDSKYYSSNKVSKSDVEKIKFDMTSTNSKYGIIISLTTDTFNVEYVDNCIVILYVSENNKECTFIYLEIFIKMFLNIPENNNLHYIGIDNNVISLINEHNDIIYKLQSIKISLAQTIQLMMIYNNKLKESIENNFLIEANNVLDLNIIKKLDDGIVNVLKSIKLNSSKILYNDNKIILSYNDKSMTINIDKDKQKKYKVEFINIDQKEMIEIMNKYCDICNFNYSCNVLSFDIVIKKNYNEYVGIINDIICNNSLV